MLNRPTPESLIVPIILTDEKFAEIEVRVHEGMAIWMNVWMYDNLDEMPQYIQDLAFLVGHVLAERADKQNGTIDNHLSGSEDTDRNMPAPRTSSVVASTESTETLATD